MEAINAEPGAKIRPERGGAAHLQHHNFRPLTRSHHTQTPVSLILTTDTAHTSSHCTNAVHTYAHLDCSGSSQDQPPIHADGGVQPAEAGVFVGCVFFAPVDPEAWGFAGLFESIHRLNALSWALQLSLERTPLDRLSSALHTCSCWVGHTWDGWDVLCGYMQVDICAGQRAFVLIYLVGPSSSRIALASRVCPR